MELCSTGRDTQGDTGGRQIGWARVPIFHLIQEDQVGVDHYAHYSCQADGTSLPEELAAEVRALYVDERELRELLREAVTGLGSVADERTMTSMIDEITASVVPPGAPAPRPNRNPPPAHLALSRNELGEILAHLAAQQVYGIAVPAKRIRHKEVPGMPARGMDLLGIDVASEDLVLGEVKTSTSSASPPEVVGDTEDSLRHQLVGYIGDRPRVVRELNWVVKHAPDEQKNLAARTLVSYLLGQSTVVAFATLVRPSDLASVNDYGCFRSEPDQFRPGHVRFCLIELDGDIAEVARDAYDLARTVA